MNKGLLKQESVWDYPRPPALEDVPQCIKVVFNGEVIVDSVNAKRVFETGHPPTYYIPLENIKPGVLQASAKETECEWKGRAVYYDVVVRDKSAKNAAWAYLKPTAGFEPIAGYAAFYAQMMDLCYVGEEQVSPQSGSFYGGWITSNLEGPFKGGPGTAG